MRAAFTITLGWLLLMCVGAGPAAAEINISITRPTSNSVAESDPLQIAVAVLSPPAEITSMQAAVGTRTITLTKDGVNTWSGSLSLTGLSRGQHQLVVTASNVAMETQQATRTFTYDNLPTLTVTSPAEHALAASDLRLTATCVDDGGPCQIRVRRIDPEDPANFAEIAAGTGSIDTVVRAVSHLTFIATDSAGRSVAVTRNITAHWSSRLPPAASFSGTILHITSDRALLSDENGTVVRIVDRTTNASQTIWTGRQDTSSWHDHVTRGFLTASGALFVTREFLVKAPQTAYLQEWRGGTLTNLGAVQYDSLQVDGPWALFAEVAGSDATLVRRDLLTGTNTVVADEWGEGYDISPDGRVFYVQFPTNEILRWDAGPPPATTQLTSGAPARSTRPATDGVNVVFTRTVSQTQSVILRRGDGTEIVLAQEYVCGYYVKNGWVAFCRRGPDGWGQVWRRAPDGTERQLGADRFFPSVLALSDTGEVIFEASVSRRFVARADGSVVELGFATGDPVLIDGAWYMIAGAHLLAVDTETPSRSILSEGATGTFFSTDVAILNPHASAVPVTIRYLRENAPELQETRTLPALSRTTIHADDIQGLEGTSVSTVVEAPAASPVVAERLMTWDASAYGGHLGASVDRPRLRWLFAEGAQGFFSTFFLLANSGADTATVTFTFLVEQGTPVTHTVDVAAGTRKTVYAGDVAALVNRSFAALIESDVPIVAERAMYFGDAPLWSGGHGSAGVPEPSHFWFHAEGATGSLFETFILLANPHPIEVKARLTYRTDSGQSLYREKVLPASSRVTINLEDEAPELANAAVSTFVSSTYPIVAERAMYWGTTGSGWREAHNSFGATERGPKWGLAEGRNGGARGYQTYVLVSNFFFSHELKLRATFIKEDGTTVVRSYTVAGDSRHNINTGDIPELADSNFSTIIESIDGHPISVESAIYWDANGVIWEGGGNTVATRLP